MTKVSGAIPLGSVLALPSISGAALNKSESLPMFSVSHLQTGLAMLVLLTLLFFFFWSCCVAWGISAHQPGIKPVPSCIGSVEF